MFCFERRCTRGNMIEIEVYKMLNNHVDVNYGKY